MTFVFICDSHGVIFHPLSAKIELKKNGSLLIVNFFLHLKNVCGLWTVIFFFSLSNWVLLFSSLSLLHTQGILH